MSGQKKKYENQMPTVDDGWWDSVLAEESHSVLPHQEHLTPTISVSRKESGDGAAEKKIITDWNHIKKIYLHDEIISLMVTGHNRGGLLVEGKGLYGFVPVSHLVENDEREDFESYIGHSLKLKVIECVPDDGRVVFSERAAQSGPGKRAELFQSLKPGQTVNGVVTNITDFGVFIDLGGVEGLIHISELSWGRVSHPSQIVNVKDNVDAQILEISPERCRVALSLKRTLPNPWTNASHEFPEGSTHSAVITSVLSFGAFARLDAGVEGLIHVSEIPQAEDKPLREFLSNNDRVQVRILNLDAAHQRLGLSMRLE